MVNFQRADGTEVPAYASEKGPKNGLVVIQVNALPANPRSSGPVWRAGQTGLHLCRWHGSRYSARQEWWGINDQIKATAGNMADKCGVRVCIPDLYRSKIAYEAAEASHLLSELDWPGAMQV
jgi:hypothetical protein